MPTSDLNYYLAWLKEQLRPQVCPFSLFSLSYTCFDCFHRAMIIFKVFVVVYK